ncbi:MAG: hypothetical protein J6U20_10855 [Fibrobacter sp.]|nr:hypothetical protein [Fibrobacter sp.]
MKKFFYIPLLILTAMLHAAESKGIEVQVELVSGTTQKAQFLGIERDTVNLGGYIKDQFTIVRIPKSQFKSIVDKQGNDLLNAPVDSSNQQASVPDSSAAPVDSAASPVAVDSASAAVAEADSSQKTSEPAIAKVFVGYEAEGIETQKASLLAVLTAELLDETGSNYAYVDSKQVEGCSDNSCIQDKYRKEGTKEILFGKISRSKSADSLDVELKRVLFEDSLPTITSTKTRISSTNPLSDAVVSNKIRDFVRESQGIKTKQAHTKSYIHVETDPEGAMLSRSEKDALCKTPCTFVTLDTGKIVLNAYWKVEHLWGAQTTVRPIPGDTVKISLKLKRISPEIRIMTQPSGAEIYTSTEEITKRSKPIAHTPNKFTYTDPGMVNLRLRREGYRDSLVSFYLAPVPETTLNIELQEIKDFNEMQAQKDWIRSRKIYHLGQALMGSAIAPAVVGALFLYLGQRDYSDAKDLKDELKMPTALNGENFQKKKEKNNDLAKSGDRKTIAGASFIGAGILLFGIGLYLTF